MDADNPKFLAHLRGEKTTIARRPGKKLKRRRKQQSNYKLAITRKCSGVIQGRRKG